MTEVSIPLDRLSAVQSDGCAQWLVNHAKGSAIGHMHGAEFFIRFELEEDAEAFRDAWLRR